MNIAPSILSANFLNLGADLAALRAAGATLLHVDVMDGRFVPNISFGLPVLKALRGAGDFVLDVHLMIIEPEKHIAAFRAAGADALTVHVEACPNLHRVLQEIGASGARVGVALNPHTPAVMVGEVLGLLDQILVMTVNPGAGGQAFLYETLPKIRTLHQMIAASGRTIQLWVDGGIDTTTLPLAQAAGAEVCVAGTAVFGATGGIAEGLAALQKTGEA